MSKTDKYPMRRTDRYYDDEVPVSREVRNKQKIKRFNRAMKTKNMEELLDLSDDDV